MRTERVVLDHAPRSPESADRPLMVTLREPTGRDELAVDGVDTRAAIDLLDRLLCPRFEDGSRVAATRMQERSSSIEAAQLAACDRDALLATLHRQCFSDSIVSTLTCESCEERFDLSFELSALQRHEGDVGSGWRRINDRVVAIDDNVVAVDDNVAHTDLVVGREAVDGLDGDGVVHRSGGLRVPCGRDEIAAVAPGERGAAERLAALCGVERDGMEVAGEALQSAAPILDVDLVARCPECDQAQTVQFDLQSFVLQRLLDERPVLLAQIHALAAAYGWSCGEILSLERSTRRMLFDLVIGSRTPASAIEARR
jgi:hypothetical protein